MIVNLKSTVLSAGRWTAASALLRSGLQLLQTMILARLLVPADFGLMAVAATILAILNQFSDLGSSRALIHYPTPGPQVLSSLYWLNVGLGTLLMLGLALAAPVLGLIYDEPVLVPLLLIISLIFPLSALGAQFRTIAEKELRFAELARNEILSSLLGFILAVIIAWLGGGVYALAVGAIATAAISSLLAGWLLCAPMPSLHARFSDLRPYLRFGTYLVGGSFANTVRMHADIFIAGLLLGPAAIGIYTLPKELCLRIANTVINPVATRIGFPVMARFNREQTQVKSVYLQTIRITASVNAPLYLALFAYPDEIAALLLGAQWREAGIYLRILAAWGLIRSVGNPMGGLLQATGLVRRSLVWNLGLLALLPPLYFIGIRVHGLQGLAWTMLGTQLALFLPAWRLLVYPACGARLIEYVSQIAPPFAVAAAAGGFALAAGSLTEGDLGRLLLGGATGVISYFGLSLLVNRTWIISLIELLRVKPAR